MVYPVPSEIQNLYFYTYFAKTSAQSLDIFTLLLCTNIVDFAEKNKSHNGLNNEGKNKKSHNIYFEGLFDADHG